MSAEAVRVAFEFFSQRAALGFAIPEWLPTPNNLQYHSAVSRLDSAVYGIIQDRQQRLPTPHTPSSTQSQVNNKACTKLCPLVLMAVSCIKDQASALQHVFTNDRTGLQMYVWHWLTLFMMHVTHKSWSHYRTQMLGYRKFCD